MKKLSIEKMEKIEGGLAYPSIGQLCQAYAWAVVVSHGIADGTDVAYIVGDLAYGACLESL